MSFGVNIKRRGFIQRCAIAAGALGFAGRRAAADSRYVPAPGAVAAISGPGTDAPSTLADVMYWTAAGPGSRNGNSYFGNWCSGVYAPDDGTYGSLVFCNGGDADYWGNEVYKFSLDTRTWSRVSERSSGLNGQTAKNEDDPNFDTAWGEHVTPGGKVPPQPGVPHSYDQMEYLPPRLGGGARGAFLFPTRTIVYRYRAYKHPHIFDLSAKTWRRGSAAPGIVGIGNVDSPSWCFDSLRGRFWGIDGGASGIFITKINYLQFDPKTRLASAHGVAIPQYLTPWGYPVSRYWRGGDLMLVAGLTRDGTAFGLWACPLATAEERGFVALPLGGKAMPPPSQGYGFAYCGDLDCFFVRTSSAHRQKMWKITPPKSNYLASTWTVEEINMGGVTVAEKGNGQGMWKRLMYAPPLKCLIWVDDVQGPVYAYRPAGT